MPVSHSEDRPDSADIEWVRSYHERLKRISVVDALDGVPPFPRLPANLDDSVALDNWAAAWNAWIAHEAVQLQRPLLKTMTPETLAGVVRAERRVRDHEANSAQQRELIEAKNALNALEERLKATDPVYEAKRALLVPILKPIFSRLPPSQWVAAFQQAYSQTRIPPPDQEHGRKLADSTRSRTLMLAIANLLLIPAVYALIAWILSIVDSQLSFWAALVAALGIMVLAEAASSLHKALLWILGGRTIAINNWLHFLRHNEFPAQRRYRHDGIGNYLSRIEDDGGLNPRVRMSAREMATKLAAFEKAGMFTAMRMRSAAEAALDLHAPRANAPEFNS
jgi:hypothetical protein